MTTWNEIAFNVGHVLGVLWGNITTYPIWTFGAFVVVLIVIAVIVESLKPKKTP